LMANCRRGDMQLLRGFLETQMPGGGLERPELYQWWEFTHPIDYR
jgi:hypothetical protein